jgi:putative PIN family toxin of toxin-antitoxin system
MSTKIRVVFDLNVLFSGIGWKGSPHDCLKAARTGRIKGFVAAPALPRLKQLLIAKLGYPEQQAQMEEDDLKSYIKIVPIKDKVPRVIPSDPEDDIVLECALRAKADYIVSGDKRHLLPLKEYQGIPILAPSDFLRILGL